MIKITLASTASTLCCVVLAVHAAAAKPAPTAKPPPAADVGDARFNQLVDDFVFGELALSPTSATQAGYHRHHGVALDAQLDDFSAAGINASRAFFDDMEKRLNGFDAASLDQEQRADVDIMRNGIGAGRLDLDEIQSYRHNPTTYVELVGNALYTPYVLHYAPAAERFKHIIARLEHVPLLVSQAQANLMDAPEAWNKVAQEENQGNIDLIDGLLRKECPQPLRKRYDTAATGALTALRGLNVWMAQTLSKKTSDWRLGKERYAKKFKYTLVTGKTPDELLKEAEADLAKTREELVQLSAPKSVEEALADVAGHHATPDTYIAAAKRTLITATAFVKAKDLLTLPPNANLQVIETPAFMRGVNAVGGFNPAPPLEPKLGAFYWVTPIDAKLNQDRIDSKLREYNDSGLQHLTVHEAMPGHYVQGEYANALQPRPRRLLRMIFGNGPYVEGWAVYAQAMMGEQGYMSDTPGYRLTMAKQMLRVLSNTILDVRLQTKGMTDEQAMELMTKGAYQETEEATAKLQRAKLSSCQLPTYYAGYKGWIDVRENYRNRQGAGATLKQFHEAALKQGAVPLPVLDQLLQ